MNVGRMGALAVALGIGWALAGPACTASAAPAEDDGATASASSESGSARAGAATGKRSGGGAEAGLTAGSESTGRSGSAPAAASLGAGAGAAKQGNDAPAAASAVRPAATAVSVPSAAVASAAVASASAAVEVEVAEEVLAVTSVAPEVAPASAAPVAPFVATRAQRAAARAAVFASSAHTVTGVDGLPGSGSGGSPVQAALAFSVLAAARRDFEQLDAGRATASAVGTSLTMGPNLLVNPGAELGDPSLSGFSAVTMPGWEIIDGTPTVIKYGTPRNFWPIGTGFKMPDLPSFLSFPKASTGPADGGEQFFGGGDVATGNLRQLVDLSAAAADIDLGSVSYDLSGWFGGFLWDFSAASVQVNFLDEQKLYLGSAQIGPVTALDRWLMTGFKERETSGYIPEGTRTAEVVLTLADHNPRIIGFRADYNNAYADNLSFTISSDAVSPAPLEPPASQVGELDHVIMVYMENKGYDDIVGSPYAPYLNSLINAYGFANDYHGLTHPSLPNYYPIVGGTDFGLTYNCGTPCIDAETTLVSNIEDAGKTWSGYAQSMPAPGTLEPVGDYSPEELPFYAFSSIANDPARAALVKPLEQMAIDFASPETAPNFAWFAANEDFNGEGPVDFPWGMLKFAIGQLEPTHPYNVPALDQFLSETVPVVINSATWNDPTRKSALFVTFDEDNNNTSLGIGNDDNHIVMVVIPSPGAVAAGMRGGPFVVSTYYNHYSLLRTIEDSLGLPRLTNNDTYANPMSEFWVAGAV
ncbi:MAG TPA: alkaline phosphatase family protein [Mycobacterium sp.]|nr:alkaline phosphatase family protein [Mycobacterium sp.]